MHPACNTIKISPTTGSSVQGTFAITGVKDNSFTIAQPGMQGQIDLKGENADLRINGVSLTETLKGIQERLNMLTVNSELENQWVELKLLGDQYRALEAELLAKQKMWDTLKK